MKKTVILLAFVALVASCGQPGGDAATYKKQVDSLKSELALRPAIPNAGNKMSTSADFAGGIKTIPHNFMDSLIYNNALDTGTANQWIQAFHGLVVKTMPQFRKSMSFLIDANILRSFVLADTTVSDLVVYIAKNSDTSLTLVYVGAAPDPSNKGKLTEQPFRFTGEKSADVMEHVFPCPDCDKIGIHPGAPNSSY